jgi:hypothetical protein
MKDKRREGRGKKGKEEKTKVNRGERKTYR